MEDKTIDIDGLKMHYRISGEGQPVVLMHGWGCNCTTVASIEAIAAEQHRVYNVDFPGFGESEEPPTIWGVEEYTRMTERLLEIEQIEKPILIGHSFGGRVAILLGSRNQTDKIILVDAAGIRPKRSLKYYFKVYTFKAGKHLTRLLMGKEKAEARIEKMRKKAGSSDYNNASPRMRAILSKVVNEDLTDRLPLIKVPTLLVWGENDTATPLRDAKIMEREIPDAGLVVFPGCGHYSFLENPRQFAAVLRSFINNKE